jgi:hypothetical protein
MGMRGQRYAPSTLYSQAKDLPVPIVQEAGWASELVWTQRLEKKFFASAGNRTSIAQSSSLLSDTILTELRQLLINDNKIIKTAKRNG